MTKMTTPAHKELVITNVEFCMLNFYKMQWESQQQRTKRALEHCDQLEKANKRQKRELDHREEAIRILNDIQHNYEQDNDILRSQNVALALANNNLAEGEYKACRDARKTDAHNINLLVMIGNIFEDDVTIKDKYLPIIQQELNSHAEAMGLPTLHTNEQLSDSDYDSDATEPNFI